MLYNKKSFSRKVRNRINRHKRVRYHNDAVLFTESEYSTPRKRTMSLKKRDAVKRDDRQESSVL